jgi:polyisoprenyl-phosphate glycosyltransferase
MVVSIVVPVFRNAQTIDELYHQVNELFKKRNDIELELYFVDDGSDDASLEKIHIIASQDVRVRYLSFDKNYGQVAAIVAGLRGCSGDAAVVMSADLQDPIAKIEEMIEAWIAGYSIVICYRTSREDKLFDRFLSFAFYGLMHLRFKDIPIGGFDFFLLNRASISEFNQIERKNRFLQGDIVKLNGSKIYLPYERQARKTGKSQWTFFRKLRYALTAINYR